MHLLNLSLSHLAEPDEASRPDAHLSEESSLFSSSFEDKLFPKTCLPSFFSADLIFFFSGETGVRYPAFPRLFALSGYIYF